MIRFLKRLAHFAIGAWAGWNYKSPASRNVTLVFLGYQYLEARKIGDAGFHETWQYGIGYGLGVSARWAWRQAFRDPHMAEYHPKGFGDATCGWCNLPLDECIDSRRKA